MSSRYSDSELVEGMINNKDTIIRYFFFEKCTPVFHDINHKVYNRQAEIKELVNELYLYLQANDWRKLKQFDYSTQLLTWVSFIARRFFCKKQDLMIEGEPIENLLCEAGAEDTEEKIHQSIEVENLLNKLPSPKYRLVLRKLYLEDVDPKKLSGRMKIKVENLYNLKRRSIQKLARIVGKEKNKQ